MANGHPERDSTAGAVAGAIRTLGIDQPEYPAGLRDLRDAPPLVYARGRIPSRERSIAIVGARAATPYGIAVAGMLARDLAALGYAIVSGLARGIDAAAHRGALEAHGVTVAVLPCGLDCVTPPHHAALAREITSTGGLLSERESGPPGFSGAFVKRNRLIAALSAAVVVVEAGESSGALTTAAFARRLGRPRLAVPGDVDRPASRGCLALLREGARVCAGAADVIAAVPRPAHEGGALLDALGERPVAVDEIAARARMAVPLALGELLRLQWAGIAEPCPGGRWRRAPGTAS